MVLSDRSQMSDRCLMCATTCELQLQFMSANFIFHPNGQSDYTILGDDSMIKNQSSMSIYCYHSLMIFVISFCKLIFKYSNINFLIHQFVYNWD